MKIILTLALTLLDCGGLRAADRPNRVIIFLDDAAYSDFHPFGKPLPSV
ncbi:MAG: hypothetical protein WEB53_08060 [Akkermansiaceae bacterium]